jgi:hypothetical protein
MLGRVFYLYYGKLKLVHYSGVFISYMKALFDDEKVAAFCWFCLMKWRIFLEQSIKNLLYLNTDCLNLSVRANNYTI